jgi:molybdenum cofactor biosynthesis enzyme
MEALTAASVPGWPWWGMGKDMRRWAWIDQVRLTSDTGVWSGS